MGLSKTITQKNLKRQNIGCKSRKDAKGLPFALLLSLKLHIHKPTEFSAYFLSMVPLVIPSRIVPSRRVSSRDFPDPRKNPRDRTETHL